MVEGLSLFLSHSLNSKDIISVRAATEDQIWFCEVQHPTVLANIETQICVKWFALQWCYQSTCMSNEVISFLKPQITTLSLIMSPMSLLGQ